MLKEDSVKHPENLRVFYLLTRYEIINHLKLYHPKIIFKMDNYKYI